MLSGDRARERGALPVAAGLHHMLAHPHGGFFVHCYMIAHPWRILNHFAQVFGFASPHTRTRTVDLVIRTVPGLARTPATAFIILVYDVLRHCDVLRASDAGGGG